MKGLPPDDSGRLGNCQRCGIAPNGRCNCPGYKPEKKKNDGHEVDAKYVAEHVAKEVASHLLRHFIKGLFK